MRLLWIGAVLVACNGGANKPNVTEDAPSLVDPDAAVDAPPDAYQILGSSAKSGTRLKVSWRTTPDGIKHDATSSVRFYDSLFQMDCGSHEWADGTTRCTPDAQMIVYADAQCTSKRAKSNDYGALPTFHVERDASYRPIEMFTAGAATTGENYYWERIGTSCVGPTPWFPGPGSGFPRTLNTLTPVTNVPVLTSVRMGTGPLQRYWITSSDGLEVPSTRDAYDTILAQDCSLQFKWWTDPIKPGLCVIPNLGSTNYYQDTACTIPVLVVPAGENVPSTLGRNGKLYSVGSMTTKPTRKRERGNCVTTSVASGGSYYLFGSEIGELQEFALPIESAPGHRLQPIVLGNNIGFWTGAFHDTVLDLNCHLAGQCRPSTTPTRHLYTNPQCTNAIDVIEASPNVEGQVIPDLFGHDANNQVHRVGAQHVGDLYNKLGTDCMPVYWETPIYTVFFDLDPTVIPDSAFETATLTVDP